MDDLDRLRKLMAKYHRLKIQKQNTHKKWAEWNYWASTQPWYDDWAYDNAMRPSDLKAKRKPTTDTLKSPDNNDDGQSLYALRHLLEHELDQLRVERSQILKNLWFDKTDDEWTYSLAQIAEAYGYPQSAAAKMIQLQPWFVHRRPGGYTLRAV